MSDDRTQSGFGFGLGDHTKTYADKKIQVRLLSGKIYGPYLKTEIIGFIYAKKLTGEEYILVEGEQDWRIISSEIDFFDAFQNILNGTIPKVGSKDSFEKVVGPKTKGQMSASESLDKLEKNNKASSEAKIPRDQIKKSTSTLRDDKVSVTPTSQQVIQLGLGNRGEQKSDASNSEEGINAEGTQFIGEATESTLSKNVLKNKVYPIIGVVAVLLFAGAGIKYFSNTNSNLQQLSQNFSSFNAQSWYARPLAVALAGHSFKIGALPTKLEPSEVITFPEGFNALVWIDDLKKLDAKDPSEKLKAAWWARWSWDAFWLGLTIYTFDHKLGADLMNQAQAIGAELEKKGLLIEPAYSMFKGADFVGSNNWAEAAKEFERVASRSQLAAWLTEESKWQVFWAAGAKGAPPKKLVAEYESGALEMSSQVRSAFVERDVDRFNDWVAQLAIEDPVSITLWFTTAQVNWRFNREGTQIANKLFMTGLGALSLQPQPVQTIYWAQYSEFLNVFGRQSTTNKAMSNRDSIVKGNLEKHSSLLQKWWDLNQSEFDLSNLASEVYKRSEKGAVNARDLATLFVLGYVIPDGGKYLAVAGHHYALEKQWGRAEKIFEQITQVDKKASEGWGGLVWVNASLYRFGKAFKALDSLNALTLEKPESVKYEALLYSIGREYEKADEEFDRYVRKAPNDPWAHYFMALNYLAQEKNVKCVASANLALAHAQGELFLRSKLLLLRCRVLARLQTKEALSELDKMSREDPTNVSIILELIDAQLNFDLVPQAIELTENSIRRFTRSYELRIKRGEIFERERDYDMAVAFYQRAAKDRDDTVEPLIKIGRIFELQKKYLDAAQTFEAASRKEPFYPEVYLFAARAYVKAAKPREAAHMFEKEIEERPTHVAAFLEAAEFYLQFNDPSGVVRIFQKFDTDFQDHPRVRTRLAQAYLAMRQNERASDEAQRAITLDNKQAEAHRVLGVVYEEQGQYELAKKYFQNYLDLMPGAADYNMIRAKINQTPYQ